VSVVLGHAHIAEGATAVYARSRYHREHREALQALANEIDRIVIGDSTAARRAAGMSADLTDLLRHPGAIPDSLDMLQETVRQAGWIPPWEREKQRHQKKLAGKQSGFIRAGVTSIRRSIVYVARYRLESKYAPYANASIDALEEEYHALLGDGGGENCAALAKGKHDLCLSVPDMLSSRSPAERKKLKEVSRETLFKDLKYVLKPLKSRGEKTIEVQ
jgi:hypothetical protein